MSSEITVSNEGKYIIGNVDGPITRETILKLTKEYIEHIENSGINRILSDFRGAPNKMGTLQNYDFAYKDSRDLVLPRNIRVAVVVDAGDTSHKFSETVARNAGYRVKIFESFDEALEWLLIDPA